MLGLEHGISVQANLIGAGDQVKRAGGAAGATILCCYERQLVENTIAAQANLIDTGDQVKRACEAAGATISCSFRTHGRGAG